MTTLEALTKAWRLFVVGDLVLAAVDAKAAGSKTVVVSQADVVAAVKENATELFAAIDSDLKEPGDDDAGIARWVASVGRACSSAGVLKQESDGFALTDIAVRAKLLIEHCGPATNNDDVMSPVPPQWPIAKTGDALAKQHKLSFAVANNHKKLREVLEVLEPLGIVTLSGDSDTAATAETATAFTLNSRKSALSILGSRSIPPALTPAVPAKLQPWHTFLWCALREEFAAIMHLLQDAEVDGAVSVDSLWETIKATDGIKELVKDRAAVTNLLIEMEADGLVNLIDDDKQVEFTSTVVAAVEGGLLFCSTEEDGEGDAAPAVPIWSDIDGAIARLSRRGPAWYADHRGDAKALLAAVKSDVQLALEYGFVVPKTTMELPLPPRKGPSNGSAAGYSAISTALQLAKDGGDQAKTSAVRTVDMLLAAIELSEVLFGADRLTINAIARQLRLTFSRYLGDVKLPEFTRHALLHFEHEGLVSFDPPLQVPSDIHATDARRVALKTRQRYFHFSVAALEGSVQCAHDRALIAAETAMLKAMASAKSTPAWTAPAPTSCAGFFKAGEIIAVENGRATFGDTSITAAVCSAVPPSLPAPVHRATLMAAVLSRRGFLGPDADALLADFADALVAAGLYEAAAPQPAVVPTADGLEPETAKICVSAIAAKHTSLFETIKTAVAAAERAGVFADDDELHAACSDDDIAASAVQQAAEQQKAPPVPNLPSPSAPAPAAAAKQPQAPKSATKEQAAAAAPQQKAAAPAAAPKKAAAEAPAPKKPKKLKKGDDATLKYGTYWLLEEIKAARRKALGDAADTAEPTDGQPTWGGVPWAQVGGALGGKGFDEKALRNAVLQHAESRGLVVQSLDATGKQPVLRLPKDMPAATEEPDDSAAAAAPSRHVDPAVEQLVPDDTPGWISAVYAAALNSSAGVDRAGLAGLMPTVGGKSFKATAKATAAVRSAIQHGALYEGDDGVVHVTSADEIPLKAAAQLAVFVLATTPALQPGRAAVADTELVQLLTPHGLIAGDAALASTILRAALVSGFVSGADKKRYEVLAGDAYQAVVRRMSVASVAARVKRAVVQCTKSIAEAKDITAADADVVAVPELSRQLSEQLTDELPSPAHAAAAIGVLVLDGTAEASFSPKGTLQIQTADGTAAVEEAREQAAAAAAATAASAQAAKTKAAGQQQQQQHQTQGQSGSAADGDEISEGEYDRLVATVSAPCAAIARVMWRQLHDDDLVMVGLPGVASSASVPRPAAETAADDGVRAGLLCRHDYHVGFRCFDFYLRDPTAFDSAITAEMQRNAFKAIAEGVSEAAVDSKANAAVPRSEVAEILRQHAAAIGIPADRGEGYARVIRHHLLHRLRMTEFIEFKWAGKWVVEIVKKAEATQLRNLAKFKPKAAAPKPAAKKAPQQQEKASAPLPPQSQPAAPFDLQALPVRALEDDNAVIYDVAERIMNPTTGAINAQELIGELVATGRIDDDKFAVEVAVHQAEDDGVLEAVDPGTYRLRVRMPAAPAAVPTPAPAAAPAAAPVAKQVEPVTNIRAAMNALHAASPASPAAPSSGPTSAKTVARPGRGAPAAAPPAGGEPSAYDPWAEDHLLEPTNPWE